ncbi:MAG: ATP-binding cassette domain-containing protein [Parvibaculaceae bacterium]|nr:ATP-binding cassette domain-containing protein [Parvibaculaceae bacterium]
MLSFRNATLALGGHDILRKLDLEIGQGEFIGVLGANGAGKTTLMRAVLGLLAPREGSILLEGEAPRPGSAAIGYMPQARVGLSHLRLTGFDVLASSVSGARWGWIGLSREDRLDLERALDLVAARELARRPLNELSGGERQRLMIAQVLVGRPRLLLLDEPLVSLDPGHQQMVVDLVREVSRELNLTVLFSEHDLNPLLPVLDRVLYLGQGHAALGTVEEVVTGPVLSRLYGAQIDVVHAAGRIFVMSGGQHLGLAPHLHHHEHGHDHDHGAHGHA